MRSTVKSNKISAAKKTINSPIKLVNPGFEFDLFDSLPDMYFLLDAIGEIQNLNLRADELITTNFNLPPSNFLDLINLCNREEVNDIFIQCIRFGKTKTFETQFLLGQKEIDVNISFSLHKLNVDGTENEYVFVVVQDITEIKSKVTELQRFFNIAETSLNPIQITDLNGCITYVNPAFSKASGYKRSELIGKNPRIFGSGKMQRKFWDNMWQTISSGKVWFGEIEDKRKNGEPFYAQLLISPFFDKDKRVTGYFGIHSDLSDKRLLEKQLIRTQKMESIGTLAAGIAHEVGNPLASISALVQVAQRSTEETFIKEKLDLVKSQVIRISKIIRDLVDFSRPSNFELRSVNINECLKEAIEITRVGTKTKHLEFDIKLSDNLPNLPLVADQLEQVFVNILLNAVDAINDIKDETIKKIISVESSLSDDEVIITFTDNGSGISETNLNKIFEPFFTTKSPGKGTGLGLWVSYGIIRSFQGNLEVRSSKDMGTTFIITLPIIV